MSTQEGQRVMRFKLDENLPAEAAEALCRVGHDAVTVLDQSMGGAMDGRLADLCRAEGRVLVTLDLDFSNIQAYPPSAHAGIIVLRLPHQDKSQVLKAVAMLIPYLSQEPLVGRLWVMDEHKIRIRA